MTTAAESNYGVVLGLQDSTGYVSIGEVVSVDPPEYMNPEVEATNHSSAGVREFISGGLREMSPFKAVLNYVAADLAPLVTLFEAGTKSRYELLYPNSQKQHFGALITGIKPLPADAQNPEVLRAELSFRPSDSLSIDS